MINNDNLLIIYFRMFISSNIIFTNHLNRHISQSVRKLFFEFTVFSIIIVDNLTLMY